MKKLILLLTFMLFFLNACSKQKLSIPVNNLTTNENGVATIEGKTNPNSNVYLIYDKMGMGEEDIVEKEN